MTLTRLLVPSALLLVTGFQRTAYCQWLEITVTGATVLPDYGPTACDAARQWAFGHRVWPGMVGTTTFDSSSGPLSPALGQGDGLMIGQWLAEPWWTCSDGWRDLVELRGGATFNLYGVDPDWAQDAASGDDHPGTARIDSVAAWGTLDGFDLSVLDGSPATITVLGSTFVVFIGQPLAASDFNADGQVTAADLFAFLAAYFAGYIRADWTHDSVVGSADIFAFLTEWFAA